MNLHQNAKLGIIRQYELAFETDDLDMAIEHLKTAQLLEDFVSDFIPMCEAEL